MSSYPPPADERAVDLQINMHGAAQGLAMRILGIDVFGRPLQDQPLDATSRIGLLASNITEALAASARLGAEMARRASSRAEVVAEIAREEPEPLLAHDRRRVLDLLLDGKVRTIGDVCVDLEGDHDSSDIYRALQSLDRAGFAAEIGGFWKLSGAPLKIGRRYFVSGREATEQEYRVACEEKAKPDPVCEEGLCDCKRLRAAWLAGPAAPAPWKAPTPAEVREAILDVLKAESDGEEGPRMTFLDLFGGVFTRFRVPGGEAIDVLGALNMLRAVDPPQIATDGEWYWRTVPRDAVDGPDADEQAPWPSDEERSGWPTEAAEEIEKLRAQLASARKVADAESANAEAYGKIVEEYRAELRLAHDAIDAARALLRKLDTTSSYTSGADLPLRMRIKALDLYVAERAEKQRAPNAMAEGLVESQDTQAKGVPAVGGPIS
jgi:hypothetical protein